MAENSPKWVEKHCGKRRNCSLGAISHFPTLFSKFLHDTHAKSIYIAIPQVFSEDSRAKILPKEKNAGYQYFLLFLHLPMVSFVRVA